MQKTSIIKRRKKKCHKENDEAATKIILQRLEEFARHARNKSIGKEVVEL